MTCAHFRLGLRLALATLLLAGCHPVAQPKFTRTDLIHQTHVADAPLYVRTHNGSIDIRHADVDEVTIEGEIKALTQQRLDATSLVVTRQPDNALDVHVQWPGDKPRQNEACSLIITIPDAGSVDLTSSNGRLTVTGVGDNVILHTSNGKLVATDIDGSIRGRTSNGRIQFTNIAGPIDVTTSNGRLELLDVRGPVTARSSNGAINLRLADNVIGPIDISTSNGSATIELNPAFAGTFQVGTSNGGVHVESLAAGASADVNKHSATIQSGAGPTSKIRTSNGSIVITQRPKPTPEPEQP